MPTIAYSAKVSLGKTQSLPVDSDLSDGNKYAWDDMKKKKKKNTGHDYPVQHKTQFTIQSCSSEYSLSLKISLNHFNLRFCGEIFFLLHHRIPITK